VVTAEIVRPLGRAMFLQIVRRGRQMVELLPEHPGVKRGVRQRADAEDNVRGVTVRIDKIVGEGQFNGETRVTRQKPRQARRDVPLSEKDRAIDTQRARRLAGAFIQLASRVLHIPGHRPGIAHKKMPALCGHNRPRVAVEKLLPEGVLKLVDHA